jgi:hypothetical protein
MNQLSEKIKDEKNRRLYALPAKRLKEKLAPLKSNVDTYQKRWLWELIQNACDYNDTVKIQIEINDSWLHFKHNGSPFSTKDAMNLISPDSAKDEDENTIGQFGTGFISTHILSSLICVSGLISDEGSGEIFRFNYTLDRSDPEDRHYLEHSIQQSEKELEEYSEEAQRNNSEFNTHFSYDLTKSYSFADAKDTIKAGFTFFNEAIPFVMAFMPKLKAITMIDKRNEELVIRYQNPSSTKEYLTVTEVFKGNSIHDLELTELINVKTSRHGDATVAVSMNKESVIGYPEDMPMLFLAYPMIGTEAFPFPCVINSSNFTPRAERDGIELSVNDTKNRQIIENAVQAYENLIRDLCEKGYKQLYHLCKLNPPSFSNNNSIKEWYKESIQNGIKSSILENQVIVSKYEKRYSLKEVYIPFTQTVKLYEQFYDIAKDSTWKIPSMDESYYWYEILNFSIFSNEKLDCQILLEKKRDKKLSECLREGVDKYKWINRLIKFILDSDQTELLYDYLIIPTKSGHLKSLKVDLYWDSEIPNVLKEIYRNLTNSDYELNLLHSSVEEFGDDLLDSKKQKTEKDICEEIDKAFREFDRNNYEDQSFINALQSLLKYIDGFTDDQLKEYLPWFSSQRATLVMNTIASDENRESVFKILQSGKMTAFASLSETGISEDQIYFLANNPEGLTLLSEITKNGTDLGTLKRLNEATKEVGLEKVLEIAEKEAEEKSDFNFKRKIGHKVEKILEELLHTEFPFLESKFVGKGPYDFIIKNRKNQKCYHIELKSIKNGSQDSIKMALSQAAYAVKNKQNYALCVIIRPNENSIVDQMYLKNNIKCVYQVGTDVKRAVSESENVKSYIQASNSIKLSIKDPEMKVELDQTYIKGLAKGFTSLKEKISKWTE